MFCSSNEAQSHLPLSALLTCVDGCVVANNIGSLNGMQQVCGHLPVATWQRVMIDDWYVHTRVHMQLYCVYIYINARVLYTYTVYTCMKRQGTTASCHTCNYTHLLGWTHAQRNMCIMWVNCWYKMQRLPIFHMSHRVCAKHPSPKISKNSAFGTSTNHLAKRKTRQAHSHEGNFSGQVLGVFLYLSWTIDFETLKPSF